jgi:tRNA (guanine37-N1)-methyltransferase
LRKRLQNRLPPEEAGKIYNSYDIVGSIAIIKMPNSDKEIAEEVAKAILSVYKKVKTVFVQESTIVGDFRVRKLRCLAGENNAATVHKESGCLFKVNVEECYFSPRLLHERSRISEQIKSGETIVNMFAGVGCFSILIAKKAADAKIYSIDINPAAVKYMMENINLNRVYGKVIPLLGDSKNIIGAQLQRQADRVLMPLPEKALEYLPYALSALKLKGGWVHYYDFEHATRSESPPEKTKHKVAERLDSLGISYDFAFSRIVRSTGPNWYQTVLDIQVKALPSKF